VECKSVNTYVYTSSSRHIERRCIRHDNEMPFLTVYVRLCAWYGQCDSQIILGKMKLMEEGNIRFKLVAKLRTPIARQRECCISSRKTNDLKSIDQRMDKRLWLLRMGGSCQFGTSHAWIGRQQETVHRRIRSGSLLYDPNSILGIWRVYVLGFRAEVQETANP
jgi:hypothetical protein